ncbi:MAG: hypothetical protein J0L62_14450 [Bacteroidetes bacterium]|nr:hypothetical protein [Bacteroidota bacterium]
MKLAGKLTYKGTLISQSPILIGSGESDLTDIDIYLDSSGNPFIPASSLVGVWRHSSGLFPGKKTDDQTLRLLFGYSEGEEGQISCLIADDLTASQPYTISIRDGIRIAPETGVVEDGKKFDYQILESGVKFSFEITVNLPVFAEKESQPKSEDFQQIIRNLLNKMNSGEIRFGRKTTNGFGHLKFIENKVDLLIYDFKNPDHISDWMENKEPSKGKSSLSFTENPDYPFSISITANVRNSILIRAASSDVNAADASQLRNGKNEAILPASSLKGPIRHQAQRILTLIAKDTSKELIDEMWGFVEDGGTSKTSNVRMEETLIEGGVSDEVQTRIKIDRFTGGTIEGALLEEQPVFGLPLYLKKQAGNAKVVLNWYLLNEKDWQAGLLLFLLRDLVQGRIRFGGGKAIGRGVLEPTNIQIHWKGKTYQLTIEIDESVGIGSLKADEVKKFDSLLEAFQTELKKPAKSKKEEVNHVG